ncbi:MAG: hypothetical protein EBX99_13500 [Acidimicrobiia bacterium]|nr:hypothetical protein [Acidimicrobiia bacterium]
MPMMAPTRGATTETALDPGRSAADSAPTTAKAAMPMTRGHEVRRLDEPRTSDTTARTRIIPTRNAVLSLVPNQSMANSFNHRGVRSMNEPPTASMGDGRLAIAATSIPAVTATAPLTRPATAAAQRGTTSEGRSGSARRGARGSISGVSTSAVTRRFCFGSKECV